MNRAVKMKSIAFLCTVLLIGGFIIGYIATYERGPDKLHKPDVSGSGNEEVGQEGEMTVEQVSADRVNPDTRLIFKTLYTECGHIIVERRDVPGEVVDFTEEMLERYYKLWDVRGFSGEEVVLAREIDGICPEHFLLGSQDGYIALYYFGEDGKPILKEITDIPISILRLNDQHRLRKGILLDNMQEVNQFLEEFSS